MREKSLLSDFGLYSACAIIYAIFSETPPSLARVEPARTVEYFINKLLVHDAAVSINFGVNIDPPQI